MKVVWEQDLQVWQKRDLSHKYYVYFCADGIYYHVRKDQKQCLLVIVGAIKDGKKELVLFDVGLRESELLLAQFLTENEHPSAKKRSGNRPLSI